ncbi:MULTISPECIES: hypothetical protein [unclassified Pseudoxanthomonas]|uniref:hypothetical protein n=1 Tax=unclassified Pseudoxanthomonas TaxID=2645906 RepID=UPI00307826EF
MGELDWEIATRILAIVGAVLGIYNAFIGFVRGRRRFKVRAMVAPGQDAVEVKIINHGTLPVTLSKFYLTRAAPNGGGAPHIDATVDRDSELPVLVNPGTSELFQIKFALHQQAFQGGHDIVVAEAADGMQQQSWQCEELHKIFKRR